MANNVGTPPNVDAALLADSPQAPPEWAATIRPQCSDRPSQHEQWMSEMDTTDNGNGINDVSAAPGTANKRLSSIIKPFRIM